MNFPQLFLEIASGFHWISHLIVPKKAENKSTQLQTTLLQSVTEQTLQCTMDFCEHMLGPMTPEMHAAVATHIDPILLVHKGPIMDTKSVAALAGKDEEVKHVLWCVNARKAVEWIYDWEKDFEGENLDGFSVLLECGRLGLRRLSEYECNAE
jgi:hypothetical protein